MTETNNPSGADVDPLALIDAAIAGAEAPVRERRGHREGLIHARTAVAALIARNAELAKVAAGHRDGRLASLEKVADLEAQIASVRSMFEQAALEYVAHRRVNESERAALAAENKALREALSRQGDNMAFVLNNCDIPEVWYAKLNDELAEDRATLARTPAATTKGNDDG